LNKKISTSADSDIYTVLKKDTPTTQGWYKWLWKKRSTEERILTAALML